MPLLIKDIIHIYYACPDPRKAKEWRIERETAISLFYCEAQLQRQWNPNPAFPMERSKIIEMLEKGQARILGLPVVTVPSVSLVMEDGSCHTR